MASFTFSPLTPTAYLRRSALVTPDRVAVIDGDLRLTYAQLHDRAMRLTGLLAGFGVGPGDRVAALCANSAVMLELHHGVPDAGAVLVPLNVRLSAGELVQIIQHAGARVLVATHEFAAQAAQVADATGLRCVVAGGPGDEYERLLAESTPQPHSCTDERALLAINYTSGTTGDPKGVMYHHRGAALQALAMAFHTRMNAHTRYLWTLPMFHCNGWCFTWATVAAGATSVCLRKVDPALIWQLLRTEGISHFSAAPTVLSMITAAAEAAGPPLDRRVRVDTGGAPPSPSLIASLADLGMDVTHLYGLTETYGPIALNDWHPEWDGRPADERATLNARQGVGNVIAEPLRVVDAEGGDVPADGQTIGEIVARGNDVMLGYYRDEAATERVTVDGWFRTGDLAVMHPDHYVEIKDRAKDIIVSGGENIASVEVERVLAEHPAVLESAVVGVPDDRWGEVPVAYVALRSGATASVEELRDHVRSRIAAFKVPKHVVFQDLPRTSTGKIQKNLLRQQVH
ncbi:MAG: AMP-binding protein [Propionibacteriales bacterium]|nr:AMP-binding protein [Propionibacteriales bacterium]